MGKNRTRHLRNDRQKNVVRIFDEACYRSNRWNMWCDFVTMAAISISNIVDRSNAEAREKTYKALAGQHNKRELGCFAEMFAEIVMGIDENPDQDFLGELFMALELGNQYKGQFFTPYDVCRAMAAITFSDETKQRVGEQGWISVNDPACGAGALLIAYANECRRPGHDVNYQTSVLFVAQDIDLIAACMCYIQLSILGCPGYVVVANTLTNPITSIDGRGLIPVHGENIWYTPFYFRNEWHWRRQLFALSSLLDAGSAPIAEKEALAIHEPAPSELEIRLNENRTGQLSFL